MICIEKRKKVYNLINEIGLEEAALKENLSETTAKDYARRWVQYCEAKKLASGKAKILCFDIETNFMKNATWGLWKQNIHIGQILESWSMLCWSAKWLFEDEIFNGCVTPEESLMRNDKNATIKLWNLIDEADIIIAHNLVGFDRKKMNTCFHKHGLGKPSPYQMIDTLQISRKNLSYPSNKLDYIAKENGIPMKHDTGFPLWRECDGVDAIIKEEIETIGNKIQKITTYNRKVIDSALKYMSEYCDNDVSILEAVYLVLRQWDTRHPNLALYGDSKEGQCHICGSINLTPTKKKYITAVSRFDAYRCNDCGSYSRVRFADKREKGMLRGVAK